jgi:hypothetical protein
MGPLALLIVIPHTRIDDKPEILSRVDVGIADPVNLPKLARGHIARRKIPKRRAYSPNNLTA